MSKRKPLKMTKSGRDSPMRPRPGGPIWLFGAHAVLAALANPRRKCHRLLLTPEAEQRHGDRLRPLLGGGQPAPEKVKREQIEPFLTTDAVHQGLALLAEPLDQPDLADILADVAARPQTPAAGTRLLILALDQVTDPHNVGAIMRSAAAFGVTAVVAPGRHAAPETGTLAKAASGALEIVPYVGVTNLVRALDEMKQAGFWSLGLAGEADRTLADADPGGPLVLVLGAEGPGLRRLTREHCDLIARLPTRPPIESLNVSNAAAVALYALMTG